MIGKFIVIVALILGVSSILPNVARADLVTISFTGLISGKSNAIGSNFLSTDITSGSYTIDTNILDTNPDLEIGYYSNALTAFSLDMGRGATASITNPGAITIKNQAFDKLITENSISAVGADITLTDGLNRSAIYTPTSMQFSLTDITGTKFANDGLQSLRPHLFDNANFIMLFSLIGGDPLFGGGAPSILTLDSDARTSVISGIEPSPELSVVPLPPSAILFGTALFGLGAISRRRKKKAAQFS